MSFQEEDERKLISKQVVLDFPNPGLSTPALAQSHLLACPYHNALSESEVSFGAIFL